MMPSRFLYKPVLIFVIDIYSVYFKHIQNHTKTTIISCLHKVGDIRTIKFATRILQKNNGTNTSETDMIRSFILVYDSIMMRFLPGSTPNFHMDLGRRQNVQYHSLLLRVQVDSLCCLNLNSVV